MYLFLNVIKLKLMTSSRICDLWDQIGAPQHLEWMSR